MAVPHSLRRIPLLAWVIIAIIAGVLFGQLLPEAVTRVFVSFNDIFGQFLGFAVPLIIVGLVTPAIADLGAGAGKWLGITVGFAYASAMVAGFFTFLVGILVLPRILTGLSGADQVEDPSDFMLSGYLDLQITPIMDVMAALLLAFIVGIVVAGRPTGVLQRGFAEFREVITTLIVKIIIPLLPLHIFGIFLNLTHSGQAVQVIATFLKVMVLAFVLHIVLLVFQYGVAGAYARRNPVRLLATMMPAYFTALGTSSSAATIPVTLRQTKKNGVSAAVADFVIPLCATIHLSGSTLKITLFSMAIMVMYGQPLSFAELAPFILMLGVIMVAAPGVPGGAIMAAVGILHTMLGFDDTMVAMMIATYIAIDSFGTATNVTGDGAIAVIMDKLTKGKLDAARLDGKLEEDIVPLSEFTEATGQSPSPEAGTR